MGAWLARLLAEESHGDEESEESEDCDSATFAWKSERIQLWAEACEILRGGYSIRLSPNTRLMWGRQQAMFNVNVFFGKQINTPNSDIRENCPPCSKLKSM